MNLIVNADDLGYHPVRDDGILYAFEHGVVTQASLMVNGASAVTAVAKAKRANLPLGLHLNLSEGRPLSPRDEVPSLVDEDGRLLGKAGLWAACADGAVRPSDVAREANVQLRQFALLVGRSPTHVDGHQHAHVAPGMAEVLSTVFKAAGVRTTRVPDELLAPCTGNPFYTRVVEQARAARRVYRAAGLRCPDCFIGLGTMGENMTPAAIASQCRRSVWRRARPRGWAEWMVHPGLRPPADDREAGGCGAGVDDFCRSIGRETELRALTNPLLRTFFQRERYALKSWDALAADTGPAPAADPQTVVAIVADMSEHTGNETTASRWSALFEDFSSVLIVDTREDSENGDDTLVRLHARCVADGDALVVVALNARRGARLLRKARAPYILVAGGTDVNDASTLSQCCDTLSQATHIVVFTEDMAQKIRRLPVMAAAAAVPVSWIPQSIVAPSPAAPWLRGAVGQAGRPYEATLILLPAGIRPVKDPGYLIDAVAAWHTRDCARPVRLVVIGPVRDAALADALAARQSASFQVLPPVPQGALAAAMCEADIVVNTSISEGMSSALLEAMDLQACILARDIPANRALLAPRDGDEEAAGELFSSPDEFVQRASALLADTTGRRARMGAAAMRRVRRHHGAAEETRRYRELVVSARRTEKSTERLRR